MTQRTFSLTKGEAMEALKCMAIHMFRDHEMNCSNNVFEITVTPGVIRLVPSGIVGVNTIKEVVPEENEFTALIRPSSDPTLVAYLNAEAIDVALFSYVYSFRVNPLESQIFKRAYKYTHYRLVEVANSKENRNFPAYEFQDVTVTLEKTRQ